MHKSVPRAEDGMTNRFRSFVGDRSLAVFVVLACAFSWWLVPVAGNPLGSGPCIAALVVLWLSKGWPGVRDLLRQIVKWRVSWKWYALAVLLPITAAVVAAVVTVRLGAPAPTASELSAWTDIVPFFFFALLVPLLGPWEEPGFRGFALSKSMETRSVLVASLMVAVIIVFWHLPLFLIGDIPAADVVLILAAGVVFGALVVGSGGSVLVAMVMHATSNAVSGEYISQMFTGQDAATLGWIRAGVWCLFAVAALIIGGRRFWTHPPQRPATSIARAGGAGAEDS
jgi:membrane protease YdiL (CAAX protease family)